MHIMIFGAHGKVGRALVETLTHSHDHITALTRADIDLSSPREIGKWIHVQRPDVVVNCTAMNGMEACAENPHFAHLINAVAPMFMAVECKAIGALFIHYSTDYVFSGLSEIGPLVESHMPKPCGAYGWSKYQGEEAIRQMGGFNLIFRLQSIWGDVLFGPLGVLQQMKDRKGREPTNPIKVLRQWTAPTSSWEVARATAHVINTVPRERWGGVPGIYHLATSRPVWKRDHAMALLRTFGDMVPDGVWHVAEGTLTEQRPVFSFLSSLKFAETFCYETMDWQDDLAENAERIRALLT